MHSIRHIEDSTFESTEFLRIWFGSTQALNSTDPFKFNFCVDPNQIRPIQLIQTSNLLCAESNDLIRRMEDSTFELGLIFTSENYTKKY